jgi:hypothetical protein
MKKDATPVTATDKAKAVDDPLVKIGTKMTVLLAIRITRTRII